MSWNNAVNRIRRALVVAFLGSGVAAVFCASPLRAMEAVLAWDASSDPNVIGYNVYYGLASHNYGAMVSVQGATTVTLSNLFAGVTYYVSAATFDSAGVESAFSAEVSFTTPQAVVPDSNVAGPQTTPLTNGTGTVSPELSGEVLTKGDGTLSPDLGKEVLVPGKRYTVTARPGRGQVFGGWSGSVSSASPRISFVFSNSLVLQALFVPNPFYALSGTYNGLFAESNQVRQASSGSITASVNSRGTCSGHAQLGHARMSFSGPLDIQGRATNSLRGPHGLRLTLQVALGTGAGTGTLSGQLTDGTWIALLTADRFVFNSRTNVPPWAGDYAITVPGQKYRPRLAGQRQQWHRSPKPERHRLAFRDSGRWHQTPNQQPAGPRRGLASLCAALLGQRLGLELARLRGRTDSECERRLQLD